MHSCDIAIGGLHTYPADDVDFGSHLAVYRSIFHNDIGSKLRQLPWLLPHIQKLTRKARQISMETNKVLLSLDAVSLFNSAHHLILPKVLAKVHIRKHLPYGDEHVMLSFHCELHLPHLHQLQQEILPSRRR